MGEDLTLNAVRGISANLPPPPGTIIPWRNKLKHYSLSGWSKCSTQLKGEDYVV